MENLKVFIKPHRHPLLNNGNQNFKRSELINRVGKIQEQKLMKTIYQEIYMYIWDVIYVERKLYILYIKAKKYVNKNIYFQTYTDKRQEIIWQSNQNL